MPNSTKTAINFTLFQTIERALSVRVIKLNHKINHAFLNKEVYSKTFLKI